MAKIETLEVNVTEQDIRLGIQKSCRECPNGLAIYNATRLDSVRVDVGLPNVYIYNNFDTIFKSTLPHDVVKWILKFDDGDPVEPITYTLTNELD